MPEQDTIWQILPPVLKLLLDEPGLRRYQESIDWEKQINQISRGNVVVPAYYKQPVFGLGDGYLRADVAVVYDAIASYILQPNQEWIRQAAVDVVRVKPRRILDLGCGTGTMTLLWQQVFPEAEVVGLDLSPYMLVRAADKADNAGVKVEWVHGRAEYPLFPDASFDLVSAAFLLEEMPLHGCTAVLQQIYRLLSVGGQVVILSANQGWLHGVLSMPYSQEYSIVNLEQSLVDTGFCEVRSRDVWLLNQVCDGIKSLSSATSQEILTNDRPSDFAPTPAFDTGS